MKRAERWRREPTSLWAAPCSYSRAGLVGHLRRVLTVQTGGSAAHFGARRWQKVYRRHKPGARLAALGRSGVSRLCGADGARVFCCGGVDPWSRGCQGNALIGVWRVSGVLCGHERCGVWRSRRRVVEFFLNIRHVCGIWSRRRHVDI